ncbi:transcriptional regulator [Enterococcus avium]|uniref:MurR/RpiR family transcriptional regulator n=1 Tax=Enterococcus malodoratus TaxID=71451 RepID=UPI0008ABC1DD|nr:MurR/RpiR family transcriptional regulator [Enterococcus malodoratus]BBM18899.1 transcriptional regulator [Enterococcus avium]SET63106.1 transcriptional regulator, RpiR family [Enterococcus malodoratus]
MKLEQLIHQHLDELSELDKDILQFILANPEKVQSLGILELADRVHASKSSVLRTTKKLGFSGYSELKYFLRHSEANNQTNNSERDIFEKQFDDIKKTLEYMQSVNLEPINEMFDKSQIIYCYATGFSQKNAIDEFYKMMLNFDKRVLVLPNKTELDMVMPMITKEDCVVIVSLSGETDEVKENLTTFEFRKIPLLAVTAVGDNYFARHSQFHLNYYCDYFVAGRRMIQAQSLIALNCLMDYLSRSYGMYTFEKGEKNDSA